MAPNTVKMLTAAQKARLEEMNLMRIRVRERPRNSLNKSILLSRIETINKLWDEARKTHAEIVAKLDSKEDGYITNGVFTNMQINYEDTIDEFVSLLSEFENVQENNNAQRSNEQGTADANVRPAKLPKLELPTFSGRYEDWESFHDLFFSLVHNTSQISDATKLQYLKSSLTGTAADLVKDIATTNANYASTWQALKSRFYNPRLTVCNHLSALNNLSYLKKESSIELQGLADESQRIVRALRNLKMPVDQWDIWLVYLISNRLDSETRKAWESELSLKDQRSSTDISDDSDILHRFPKFAELTNFMEKRAQALTMVAENKVNKSISLQQKVIVNSRKILYTSSKKPIVSEFKCLFCKGDHSIFKCSKFLTKSAYDRGAHIRRLRLCFNCLGSHKFRDCTSNKRCMTCREKHHTLLHFGKRHSPQSNQSIIRNSSKVGETKDSIKPAGINSHTANVSMPRYAVLLAKAQIIVIGPNGNRTIARALLDQGSEVSFISESITQLLGLSKYPVNISLTGVGASAAGTARHITKFTLQSVIDSNFILETEALVLGRLTSKLPTRKIISLDIEAISNLSLADPHFNEPNKIDLILGADIYGRLLKSGLRRFSSLTLTAQNTRLGWIISGPVSSDHSRRADNIDSNSTSSLHCVAENELSKALEKFWHLEEISSLKNKLKPEDEFCEKHFASTHLRSSEGRYIVRLPVKSVAPNVAAETRHIALKSLAHTHRRLSKDQRLSNAYKTFMEEYERLGHMSRVPPSEIENARAWYLPHHAVIQANSKNWKLRVVFDASRRTSDNHFLNNFLSSGPALQRDLSLILLNWRRCRYVFTADIIKMFRQICVSAEDRDLQRILWTPSSSDTPIDYCLNTVTYGTTCAPFLAIRTLSQLAHDERSRYPSGAQCLEQNTYVDDIFAGADEISLALKKRDELINILGSAGIKLDKWAANNKCLLPTNFQALSRDNLKQINVDDSVKTESLEVGVRWNNCKDKFTFSLENLESRSTPTKRSVLSTIAHLFDPLGWLAPIIIGAKILMQDLWIAKYDWDSILPEDICDRWTKYCKSLSELHVFSIDRWLGTQEHTSYQIHGFADASSRAYAAVVYIRVENGGRSRVSLLAAKSKVAPVKTKSIPNLELCGAALLIKLILHIRKLDFFSSIPVFTWSDSQVVLMWLQKHPCTWKTFVANRISYIQTELPLATWRYVPTKENPADLSTRGCTPAQLINNVLWWHGPSWLSRSEEYWPKRNEIVRIMHVKPKDDTALFDRFSSLTRMIRVIAYCLRPLRCFRNRKDKLNKLPAFLTVSELLYARNKIIQISQSSAFSTEIKLIKQGKTLLKGSPIRKLNPVIGDDDILRVGGRLSYSNLSYNHKHPPILSQRCKLSLLFVQHAHYLCLHGGPTLTANVLNQNSWVLGKNRLIKTVIRNCVKCQRVKPRLASQLMGSLPATRVIPTRPFLTTGLDYAGPILIRTTKGRGHKAYKGYIALFICFTTRAIHIELVSDLTTATFLAAYRRSVSRRGICRNLYSDNATTFHGANKELKSMFNAASTFYMEISTQIAKDGTNWNFIPPNTSHYGGLWEAGVKSVKHHLKRILGDHKLTFEELYTLLTEIEACLNSRPICPMSQDIDDLSALTPGHFLVGDALTVIPNEEFSMTPENRLSRLQLIQRIRTQFWKRWTVEYLNHLQERGKWRDPTENFAKGQLVLIKDDRYPPSKWPLGRVIDVHQGPDGLVRVVTLKTATTVLRRHIASLCPLHLEPQKKNEGRDEDFAKRGDTNNAN